MNRLARMQTNMYFVNVLNFHCFGSFVTYFREIENLENIVNRISNVSLFLSQINS